MPTFDTPEPIAVTLELGVGDVRIVASDRADTVVEVRPERPRQEGRRGRRRSRPASSSPTAGCSIKAPQGWRQLALGGGDRVDRRRDRAAGGLARAAARPAWRALRCTGRLGECRYKTGVGEIRVEQAGALRAAHRRRRRRRRPRQRATPSHHRLGRGPARQRRRAARRQELQRRHLDRRGRPATCGRTRRTAGSPSTGPARPWRRRPPTATSASATVARGDGRRRDRASASVEIGVARRRRRLARPAHAASAAVRNELDDGGPARGRATPRSRSAPAPATATSPSAARRRPRAREGGAMTRRAARLPRRGRPACASRSATTSCSTASTSRSPRAPCSRCSARTAPARRPPSRSSRRCSRPDAGEVAVAGFDLAREPDAVRAAIGVTGQFSAVDNLLTGAGEPRS